MKAIVHDPSELHAIAKRVLENPGQAVALVTLVRKTGSSYRQPGARMLVLRDGSTLGTISGGCLEQDLADLARGMQESGQRFAEHTIDTRPIFGCQGTITLWIECVEPEDPDWMACIQGILQSVEQRQPITLVTGGSDGQPGATRLLDQVRHPGHDEGVGFRQSLGLRKRIVLVGAHTDVSAVVNLSKSLSWQCIQVVPGAQRRGWIATGDPAVQVLHVEADSLLKHLQPDSATAVVIMTHHLGRDISYARAVLNAGFAYVGMLGSARRRAELLDHLMDLGDASLVLAADQLHCPIGLDIGSETREQIALSMIAEVQASFAKRNGGRLRDACQPIHP